MAKPEAELQKAVCEYIDAACPDVVYAAIPNQQYLIGVLRRVLVAQLGAIKGNSYANNIKSSIIKHLIGVGMKPGWPDIVLHWRLNRTAYIELKAEKGLVVDTQEDIHQRIMEKTGIKVYIVRSIDDLKKVIGIEGIPCRDSELSKWVDP